MQLSPGTIIDLLSKQMDETELIFKEPLPVNLKGNYCLLKIAAVAVDGNNRLWIKDERGNWSEVHEGLIYCQFILSALYEELNNTASPVVVVDEVNDTRVLIVDQVK